jgi:recombination endonuclease VII
VGGHKWRRVKNVYDHRTPKPKPPSSKGSALNGERARRYGMSVLEFQTLMRQQKNRCAICREEFGPGRLPLIDHDHRTNEVRGLLCGACNHGLGRFRDRIDLLESAIVYLRRSQPRPDRPDSPVVATPPEAIEKIAEPGASANVASQIPHDHQGLAIEFSTTAFSTTSSHAAETSQKRPENADNPVRNERERPKTADHPIWAAFCATKLR